MQEKFSDESDFKRDTSYWNLYYKKNNEITKPSRFARFVIANYLREGAVLLELGCGNGRDSLFFAARGLKVIAIDASDYAINELIQRDIANAEFICGDFVELPLIYARQYDFCYARFSLHAISAAQEDLLLRNVKNSLKCGGKFFIEVRSVNDPLFGKGTPVTVAGKFVKNSFIYNEHFRRFIDKAELEENLSAKGFEIEYSEEKTGFAPFGMQDPPVIRVVASV